MGEFIEGYTACYDEQGSAIWVRESDGKIMGYINGV